MKDETLSPALKVELCDRLFHGGNEGHVLSEFSITGSKDGEKQRGGKEQKGGDFQTFRATSSSTQQEQGAEDEFEERVVIVGGKSTGDRHNAKIKHMGNGKRNINTITNNSLYEFFCTSVCATKNIYNFHVCNTM